MQSGKIFFLILLVFICVNIAVVSAADSNSTDDLELEDNDPIELDEELVVENAEDDSNGNNESAEKDSVSIEVSSTNVKTKDTLEIYLKNSTDGPLKSKQFTAILNNKEYSLKTNSKGVSKINIDLPANSYKLTVIFKEDDEYKNATMVFSIKVSKLSTKIIESGNYVLKNKYAYFRLVDSNGNSVSGKKVTVKLNGKKYVKKTNSYGQIAIKIKFSKSKKITAKFFGDNQFKASYKKVTIHVLKKSFSINIGNSKFLKNGFIRVYLKKSGKALSKRLVTLTVGGKKLKLKTNSEGIAVFKPNVDAGFYTVKAKHDKYYSSKGLKCYNVSVKDPLKESIPLKNGKPDVDFMPKNYVWGDGNAKYTLKKSQYREVLKRDSYCLFLYGKLTKYTFFKTKSHPNTYHILKREKWNVIERAINAKLVKKNKHDYWPGKITVSLKGKSYKYPLVRDPQDNGRTCGPTSCSMCSQVLKNYVCEKYIAKLAKTDRYGTSCNAMINALKKNDFVATYFFKSSFNKALNEVKNGGAALIFHAYNHYVSILDISKDGKKVLVSNSYGSYDNIPTGWLKVSYMKKKFSNIDESLIVKLNYELSDSMKNGITSYYTSMGKNWVAQNPNHSLGWI